MSILDNLLPLIVESAVCTAHAQGPDGFLHGHYFLKFKGGFELVTFIKGKNGRKPKRVRTVERREYNKLLEER